MKTKRIAFWVALGLTAVASGGLALWAWSTGGATGWPGHFGQPGNPGWAPGMGHHGPGGMGLWLVGLVAVGAWAWHRRPGTPGAHRIDPRADLALEYAEGRITRDEYLARKAVLEEQS
jgi:hypothetical protein